MPDLVFASRNFSRKEFREGFFLFQDKLWETINLRNDLFQYQDGLFRQEIPTFNEVVVREAILNAVSHRDYRLGGSVFIRQYPPGLKLSAPAAFHTVSRLTIFSGGSLPATGG